MLHQELNLVTHFIFEKESTERGTTLEGLDAHIVDDLAMDGGREHLHEEFYFLFLKKSEGGGHKKCHESVLCLFLKLQVFHCGEELTESVVNDLLSFGIILPIVEY